VEPAHFSATVGCFVEDPEAGRPFRLGLRVTDVQEAVDIMEMMFAPHGRTTWQVGEEVNAGQVHVVSRRIGTHDVFCSP